MSFTQSFAEGLSEGIRAGQSKGMGFRGWLVILFVGLKLTHFITWSWWWVFAPIWLPMLIGFVFLAVVLLVALTADLINEWVERG